MTPRAVDPRGYESHEQMFLRGDPAAPALAGIRPSAIADKIEAYEKIYADELAMFPATTKGRYPFLFLARVFGFDHWHKALMIARMELKELALAHATTLNDKVARAAQDDLAVQYRALGGDLNDFHHFLIEHFRNETIEGIDTKQTLFQIAKRLLIKFKK
jgi:hypothetical protein